MLSDITYIPQMVYSFFHHAGLAGAFDTSAFLSNHHAVSLSFLAIRICALFLAARWFYAGGPAVHEFLMGSSEVEDTPAA
jgi:hypothetical protein